jgi:hypothetical protein
MHHKASGGAIDRDETKTTIESGAKKFEKTKVVDGDHHDKHHGTGVIKDGKPAGYKHGGHAHKKHHKATGGAIPSDTHESKNKAKTKFGGTYEGNEHDYLNTEMHSAKKDKAHGTGGIHETNAGGFKHGGKAHHKMHHKATGGAIPAATEKHKREGHFKHDAIEGGDWEDRAADTSTAGVKNTRTGDVKEANAGGFKRGGHASKKAYATGGNVVDDGKAVKMPKHFVSRPVANSLQSGTFKRGGKVAKKADGGRPLTESEDQRLTDQNNRAYSNWEKSQREENEADANMIPNAIRRGVNAVKGFFGSKEPDGSVTKTKESVTVAPAKRRGGTMKRR